MTFSWTAPTKAPKKSKGPKAPVVAEKATQGAVKVFHGELTKINTMADRGVRLQIDLGELSPFDIARVYSMLKTAITISIDYDEVNND